MGVFRELLAELGRGLGIGPAAVEAVVPIPQADVVDEAHARRIVRDLANEEAVGIPAVQDIADVEDDGRDRRSHLSALSGPKTGSHFWWKALSPGAP